MAKEKVTLTLDAKKLAELRSLVGNGSLSASMDVALDVHLKRLRHFKAVDEWLVEMEQEDGPIPAETRAWAEKIVSDWAAKKKRSARKKRAI